MDAILVKVDQTPYSLTWLGAAGELHGTLLDRVELGRPACSELQRLPADAEASVRNAARLAARAFDPGLELTPEVTAVTPAGANAGGCGARTEGRVVVAELRPVAGGGPPTRVLVGRTNGHLVVWQP